MQLKLTYFPFELLYSKPRDASLVRSQNPTNSPCTKHLPHACQGQQPGIACKLAEQAGRNAIHAECSAGKATLEGADVLSHVNNSRAERMVLGTLAHPEALSNGSCMHASSEV